MNSDNFMEPNKKEVRFYLDETEYPIRDYVVEWVEWYEDHKRITRTLRSHFMPAVMDPMEVRERIIKMNGDDTPVWFMGALRHLRDHSPRTKDEQQEKKGGKR
jgi:chloramphenicol 3-O-phosphotransferase